MIKKPRDGNVIKLMRRRDTLSSEMMRGYFFFLNILDTMVGLCVDPFHSEYAWRIAYERGYGTEIQTPTDPDDADSYYPGTNGQKPYNMIHLTALYDLLQRTYLDMVVQKSKKQHERKALIQMIETSPVQKAFTLPQIQNRYSQNEKLGSTYSAVPS